MTYELAPSALTQIHHWENGKSRVDIVDLNCPNLQGRQASMTL